ncbi:SPOR domain-containing protein [Paenibacillus sp. M1]|uniref:SPOR domain-containing protein n=1 Tax=Paenibacillus haidiansis TaxID=1574488 RepID=A0ABU7VW80_9BACL
MNNAKMTFRFDGQGRQLPRETQPFPASAADRSEVEETPLHETTGFIYNDRYKDPRTVMEQTEQADLAETDTGHYENSHTEANETDPYSAQTYRAVELAAEDWGDPFTDYTGTGGTILPHYTQVRSPRTSWWKVAGSLTGAIVTGALFGFVVLSMFNGQVSVPIPGISMPSQTSPVEPAADIPVLAPVYEEEWADPASGGKTVSIAIPEETYHFLQYGVFSTAQGVQLAQQELQDSGIAAARDTVDEKRVYAGVSTDREQAKLLSSQLKTAGVHLILHEITLPASAEVAFNGDAAQLEAYFAQSSELIGLLSSLSASRLAEVTPQALDADAIAELEQKHQLWTESAAAVRGKQPEPFAAEAVEMEKAMNSAIEAMTEYNKKGAKTLLWEVQDEVMSFIMAEQKMLGANLNG